MRNLLKLRPIGVGRKVGNDLYITYGLFFAGRLIRKIKKTTLRRSNNAPYLIRWSILSTRWFSIKLHKIITSDDECLHDHPWSFISIIFRNGYLEESEKGFKRFGRGSVLFRRAKWKHRLHIPENKPATTLVITFQKTREWGFWTRRGFIPHDKYNSSFCE